MVIYFTATSFYTYAEFKTDKTCMILEDRRLPQYEKGIQQFLDFAYIFFKRNKREDKMSLQKLQ